MWGVSFRRHCLIYKATYSFFTQQNLFFLSYLSLIRVPVNIRTAGIRYHSFHIAACLKSWSIINEHMQFNTTKQGSFLIIPNFENIRKYLNGFLQSITVSVSINRCKHRRVKNIYFLYSRQYFNFTSLFNPSLGQASLQDSKYAQVRSVVCGEVRNFVPHIYLAIIK